MANARVLFNGLNWDNGLYGNGPDGSAEPQYNAGQGFSAMTIPASADITYSYPNPNPNASNKTIYVSSGYNHWDTYCTWYRANAKRQGEIVLRLYWPVSSATLNALGGDPGPFLGNHFYDLIVKPAIVRFNIRNFQVLNELNVEYEQSKSPSQIAGDMYNIAYWIKHRAANDEELDLYGGRLVYLGFPGPGGDVGDPGIYNNRSINQAWVDYWTTYSSTIKQGTDQYAAYNWLGLHSYEFNYVDLAKRMNTQYDDLVTRFPGYPYRYMEYALALGPSPNFQNRANYLVQMLTHPADSNYQGFIPHVTSKPGPDVYSIHYFLAYQSNNFFGQNYNLVADNSNLGPASTLANVF